MNDLRLYGKSISIIVNGYSYLTFKRYLLKVKKILMYVLQYCCTNLKIVSKKLLGLISNFMSCSDKCFEIRC